MLVSWLCHLLDDRGNVSDVWNAENSGRPREGQDSYMDFSDLRRILISLEENIWSYRRYGVTKFQIYFILSNFFLGKIEGILGWFCTHHHSISFLFHYSFEVRRIVSVKENQMKHKFGTDVALHFLQVPIKELIRDLEVCLSSLILGCATNRSTIKVTNGSL